MASIILHQTLAAVGWAVTSRWSRWHRQSQCRRRTRTEELVPSSEAWSTLGAKGDLKLLAEEQVLDDQTPTAAAGGDEGGLYEPDEVEHRGRIADQRSADRRAGFCLPTAPPRRSRRSTRPVGSGSTSAGTSDLVGPRLRVNEAANFELTLQGLTTQVEKLASARK